MILPSPVELVARIQVELDDLQGAHQALVHRVRDLTARVDEMDDRVATHLAHFEDRLNHLHTRDHTIEETHP